MADPARLAKIRELAALNKIVESIRKSKTQSSVLRTGLDNPAGFLYGSTYKVLARFHKLGIIEFSKFKYKGSNLGRLTPKGRAVLALLDSRNAPNVKKTSSDGSIRGTEKQRVSDSDISHAVGVQYQKIDALDN